MIAIEFTTERHDKKKEGKKEVKVDLKMDQLKWRRDCCWLLLLLTVVKPTETAVVATDKVSLQMTSYYSFHQTFYSKIEEMHRFKVKSTHKSIIVINLNSYDGSLIVNVILMDK